MHTDNPLNPITDHVFILSYAKYDKRRNDMIREMARLNISDYDFIIQFDSPIYRRILSVLQHESGIGERELNIWFGHYRAIKSGLSIGYDRILVAEDDIEFLKDINVLKHIAELAPKKYALLHLDPLCWKKAPYYAGIKKARNFGISNWGVDDTNWSWLRSAGCYCLNRVGMQAMVDLMEKSLSNEPHNNLLAIDMYYPRLRDSTGLPVYYSVPNMARQKRYTDMSQNGRYTDYAQRKYDNNGILSDKYGSQQRAL